MYDCWCGCTREALDNRSAQWRANFYQTWLPTHDVPLVQRQVRCMAFERYLVLTGRLGGPHGEDGPMPVWHDSDLELLARGSGMADEPKLTVPTRCQSCAQWREPRGTGLGYCAADGRTLPACRPGHEDLKLKDGCTAWAQKRG